MFVFLTVMSQAGLEVVLTLGMKGPRWPEFHIPAWAESDLDNEDITADRKLCDRCLDYVESLVNHVQAYSCIVAFQIENEPLDKAGEKRQVVGIDFVAEEANLVRKVSERVWSRRDKMLTLSFFLGRPLTKLSVRYSATQA